MKIIPFGDRLMVQRRRVGEKIGNLYVSDSVRDARTDIADVKYVPDLTFGDKYILDNADKIIEQLVKKACEGDDAALMAALRMNEFVKMKSIKEGDIVMISKYIGTDFVDSTMKGEFTLVKEEDVIGLIVKDEAKK